MTNLFFYTWERHFKSLSCSVKPRIYYWGDTVFTGITTQYLSVDQHQRGRSSPSVALCTLGTYQNSKSGMIETASKLLISSFAHKWAMERLIVVMFSGVELGISRDVCRNVGAKWSPFLNIMYNDFEWRNCVRFLRSLPPRPGKS